MRIYECPKHDQGWDIHFVECDHCFKIRERIKENEEVAKRTPKLKHTRMSVYWTHNDDALAKGRVIENLEHKPQRFQNKDQFRDYLKRNKIAERA